MTQTALCLIADDLTGALDAAAPFASPHAPVRLELYPWLGLSQYAKVACSTESRDRTEAGAIAQVAAAYKALAKGRPQSTLWFKKVDSVLRGHPFAETLALARMGGFSHCVFAPAFPEMGRITRAGRQMIVDANGAWRSAMASDFSAAWAEQQSKGSADACNLVQVEAETQADLQAAALRWRRQSGVLWAGSGGLARALCATPRAMQRPGVGLFVLGTSHATTRQQAFELGPYVQDAPVSGAIMPSAAQPLRIDPVPDCQSGAQTRAKLVQSLQRLIPPTDDSAIFVTGGDCLATLLDATKTVAVDCLGEIAPGLPVSRMIGGRLGSTLVISKSGGFGAPDLLCSLTRSQTSRIC